MAANDNDIKQQARELRKLVIDHINQANQDLHAVGGVKIEIRDPEGANPAKQIQTLVRDATARVEQQINWTSAYQMRTLSFLMTAITLVEIHSEHANAAVALEQLNALLPLITDPSLWNPEEKAKENFSHYVKKMSSTLLKEIEVAEKSFCYANGWVSVDLPPQIIETKSSINGTVYITRSEPICELTPAIKREFEYILNVRDNLKDKAKGPEEAWPIWYQELDDEGKKLCIYYAEKIKKGELHQLTPGLRGLIPGLKNAYKTTLIREGKEGEKEKKLLSFYHTATVPMGSEALDTAENIALTKLGYQAMQEGASGDVVGYTTLVSRHGDTAQEWLYEFRKLKIQLKNLFSSEEQPLPKPVELIDHVINDVSKMTAENMQKEGLPFYHTNVCLNGARRFEHSKVQGFESILDFIEQKIDDCPDDDLRDKLLKQHKEAKKEVHALSKQMEVIVSGDEEMRAYTGLFAFAKLVHNYNQTIGVNEDAQVRWYFGCASGQNRTQALSYSLMNQAICEDQMGPNSRALSQLEMDEIATRLAEDGHFAYINGPYDAKFGIRSKSAGSFPKSLFRAIQSMILSLADTKRPNDVLFEPQKMDDFFAELNKKSSLSVEKLSSIWEKYVHGKSGIALNDAELLGVLDELMELNHRYELEGISDNKYAFLLNLAFREQRLQFLFCQRDNKYKNVFSFIHTLDKALGILESGELPEFIETFFRGINEAEESEESTLTADEAYRLLRIVYSGSDLIDIIDSAYEKSRKVKSVPAPGDVADSEREENRGEVNENSSGQAQAKEVSIDAKIKAAIIRSEPLVKLEQLVARERRFISSLLLVDGNFDLAYDLAVKLVDAIRLIDTEENNVALLDALDYLKKQINEKDKKLATKALLLLTQKASHQILYGKALGVYTLEEAHKNILILNDIIAKIDLLKNGIKEDKSFDPKALEEIEKFIVDFSRNINSDAMPEEERNQNLLALCRMAIELERAAKASNQGIVFLDDALNLLEIRATGQSAEYHYLMNLKRVRDYKIRSNEEQPAQQNLDREMQCFYHETAKAVYLDHLSKKDAETAYSAANEALKAKLSSTMKITNVAKPESKSFEETCAALASKSTRGRKVAAGLGIVLGAANIFAGVALVVTGIVGILASLTSIGATLGISSPVAAPGLIMSGILIGEGLANIAVGIGNIKMFTEEYDEACKAEENFKNVSAKLSTAIEVEVSSIKIENGGCKEDADLPIEILEKIAIPVEVPAEVEESESEENDDFESKSKDGEAKAEINRLEGDPAIVDSAQKLSEQLIIEEAERGLIAHKKDTASRLPPDDLEKFTPNSPSSVSPDSLAAVLKCGFLAIKPNHAESSGSLKPVEEPLDFQY